MSTPDPAGGTAVSVSTDVFLLKADIDLPDEVLRSLRSTDLPDHPPDRAAVTAAVGAATGVDIVRVEGSVCGTFRWVVFADLDDGRRVAIRVNRVSHAALIDGLVREAALAPVLQAAGVPVPTVLSLDLDGHHLGAPFTVVERVRGRTLASIDDNTDDVEVCVTAGLEQLGAALRSLHKIRGLGAGSILSEGVSAQSASVTGALESWAAFLGLNLDKHLSACVAAGVLDPGEADRARDYCDRPVGPGVDTNRLLHGDPGGHNVLLASDGSLSGLVDWEDGLVGDPMFDLASAALFQPERRWPALFEGYWGTRALQPDSAERFWQYQLRIAIARTVVRRRFGLVDLPEREPAAARVHRALAALQKGPA